jgi:hypothetical protein
MRTFKLSFVVLVLLVGVAHAQLGVGINHNTTLTGTGSTSSPLGVNMTLLAGNGLTSTSTTFDIGAGTGITVASNAISVDTAVIQAKVTGTCSTPSAIIAVNTDGTVLCSTNAIDGSGTANTLAKWSDANTLTNSLVTDNGTTWAYNTNKLTITASNGNTSIAGTLGVTGLSTLTGGFSLGADSSAASHKITNLTNGSSAQDAAAFGQIATGVNAAVSGTTNKLAKFTSTNVVGDSSVTSTAADSLVVTQGSTSSITMSGTSESSYLMFGSNQDIYLRGGKAASSINIGDATNTGGINLGSASNHTINVGNFTVQGNSAFGNATTDTTTITGNTTINAATTGNNLVVSGAGIVTRFNLNNTASGGREWLFDSNATAGPAPNTLAIYDNTGGTYRLKLGATTATINNLSTDTLTLHGAATFDAKATIALASTTASASSAGTALEITQTAGSNEYISFRQTDAQKGLHFDNSSASGDGFLVYDGSRQFLWGTAGTVREKLDSNGSLFTGDTTDTAIANNVDVVTIGKNGGSSDRETADVATLNISNTLRGDTTGGVTLNEYGIKVNAGITNSCGAGECASGTVNAYGVRVDGPGQSSRVNGYAIYSTAAASDAYSGYFNTGKFHVGGDSDFGSTKNRGTITLSGGTGTATVASGAVCVCTDTTANASVKCAVSATTLTATGTTTDVIAYHCF